MVVGGAALPPSQFGVFFAAQAAGFALATVWDLGSTSLVTRQTAARAWSPGAAAAVGWSVRVRTAPLVLLLGALGLVLVRPEGVGPLALALAGVSPLLASSAGPWLGVLTGLARFRDIAGSTAAGRLVTLPLLPLALLLPAGEPRVLWLAGCVLLGEALVALMLRRRFRKLHLHGDRAVPSGRGAIAACLPYTGNSLLALAFSRGDLLIVALLTSPQQLGLYAPASQIQNLVNVIPVLLASGMLAAVATDEHSPAASLSIARATRRTIGWSLVAIVPLSVVGVLLMPWILPAVLGEDFGGAVLPAQVTLALLPATAVLVPVTQALVAGGRPLLNVQVVGAALAVSVLLHVLLVPRLGAVGGAISSGSRDVVALTILSALAVAGRSRTNRWVS